VRALQIAYATGQVTPHEVIDGVIERIAARGADAVWISRVPDSELRRQATDLERLGGPHNASGQPLFGIPFAVKDNIDVAGLPTTAACPAFSYRPARSATSVQRLIDAGAIVIGKTNLDQFATGLTGTRSPYGSCESVFGGGLISGGSSSGSAVAVAAELVSFSLGTDTAGSGRVPAAMNEIVGCKPTRGLVSAAGVVPACRSLDCVSVFTADSADAMAILDVLTGFDAQDPWSRYAAVAGPSATIDRVRIALPAPDELDFAGDHAMQAAFEAAVARAATMAAGTTRTTIAPLLEAGQLLYHGPWLAERLSELQEFFTGHRDDVLPITREVIEGGARFSAVDAFRAGHRRKELQRWSEELWQLADLLIMPTVPTTFTIDEIAEHPITRNAVLGRFTQFVNLLDMAAVTVPTGRTSDGRPASVTLIGPAFSDQLLLSVAADLDHRQEQ
jgi:allophanate hydrolase